MPVDLPITVDIPHSAEISLGAQAQFEMRADKSCCFMVVSKVDLDVIGRMDRLPHLRARCFQESHDGITRPVAFETRGDKMRIFGKAVRDRIVFVIVDRAKICSHKIMYLGSILKPAYACFQCSQGLASPFTFMAAAPIAVNTKVDYSRPIPKETL